jgi:hypothetical protein
MPAPSNDIATPATERRKALLLIMAASHISTGRYRRNPVESHHVPAIVVKFRYAHQAKAPVRNAMASALISAAGFDGKQAFNSAD